MIARIKRLAAWVWKILMLHQLGAASRPPGYVGGATLKEFQERATFVRISGAGLRESHAHDVTITRESPNYPGAGA